MCPFGQAADFSGVEALRHGTPQASAGLGVETAVRERHKGPVPCAKMLGVPAQERVFGGPRRSATARHDAPDAAGRHRVTSFVGP